MPDETLERTWTDVQGQLLALRAEGYEYLQTYDEALSWRGTHDESGISIALLLELRTFRGNIVATESSSISKNGNDAQVVTHRRRRNDALS
jgi:hypothetical protein